MNEHEQGLSRVFDRCVELFETAETVFPEERGSSYKGYWVNFESGERVHIRGGRWSILGNFNVSERLLRFEVGFKPTFWEAARLNRFKGLQFTPVLVIEKDDEGNIQGEVEYWPKPRTADKQTIPVDSYPTKPSTFLERVNGTLIPKQESIETILVNPRLIEDPNYVPFSIEDECWSVTRPVSQSSVSF